MCVIKTFLLPVNHKVVDDFGRVDGVRIARVTPWQVPCIRGKPIEQFWNKFFGFIHVLIELISIN